MTRFLALAAGLMLVAGAAAAQRTDIVVGMQLEPPNLDPTAGAAAAIDEVVYANVFEGLTRYADDGSIKPALAESWEIAPDGLSWVFHLRAGRDLPRRHPVHRRGRGLLLRPGDGRAIRPTPRSSSSTASTRSRRSTTSPWRSASTRRRGRF